MRERGRSRLHQTKTSLVWGRFLRGRGFLLALAFLLWLHFGLWVGRGLGFGFGLALADGGRGGCHCGL
jgi:hypothetical protein